jgi:hypothetical protein
MAVIGGFIMFGATGVFAGGGEDEITCGGQVMHPGDVCDETRPGGVRDTFSYEERVAESEAIAKNFAERGRWIGLGAGLGLTTIAATGMILTKRRRARQASTTADLYLQQQAAWQQQQQQRQWPAQPAHFQQQQYPPPQQYQQPPHQQYRGFGPRG